MFGPRTWCMKKPFWLLIYILFCLSVEHWVLILQLKFSNLPLEPLHHSGQTILGDITSLRTFLSKN